MITKRIAAILLGALLLPLTAATGIWPARSHAERSGRSAEILDFPLTSHGAVEFEGESGKSLGNPTFTTQLTQAQPASRSKSHQGERDGKTKAVLQLCEDWDMAYQNKDAAPLERILTADYIGIDDEGAITSKADEIALIKNGAYVIESVRMLEEPKVRFHGATAIVTTLAKVKSVYKGVASTITGRATTVCVQGANGQWQIASWHATRLKEQ